jgi:hypothetical protein
LPDRIGIPLERLLNRAILNKIPLLFYDSVVGSVGRNFELVSSTIAPLENRYSLAISLIKDLFQDSGARQIKWALFKMRKSFRYVSSDIDFLLFENSELPAARELLLRRRGDKLLLTGPHSATFFDPVANLNIDLYGSISASYFEYLNKDKLKERCQEIDFGGQKVPSLDLVGDTLVIAAHSVFKEQMYTLADFCSITDAIAQMSLQQLDEFIHLVHSEKCNLAVKILLGLTAVLHTVAFSVDVPNKLQYLKTKIKLNPFEDLLQSYVLARFAAGGTKTPYKMDLISALFIVALKLLSDKAAAKGSLSFLRLLVRRNEAADFVSQQFSHAKRSTY